jgi:SEC-C motif-containing protein
MSLCYCCSGIPFEQCCRPFIKEDRAAETAEALMRSRYSAYVLAAVDYLLKTTHVSTRKSYNASSIKNWAVSSKWLKLEILSREEGMFSDNKGKVEFKAYYLDAKNIPQVHHEYSSFVKENGRWFFVGGKVR